MHVILIAGARPNFMKIAPIIHAMDKAIKNNASLSYSLVHTGQHYDEKMSLSFFKELNIPEPAINLESGSGTQAEQTAAIMTRFEKYLEKQPADLVLVVGDVTSTLACSIVAKKANIKVAHVEGGIRSRDMTMPEEINRMVTDSITDYFFTTSEFANNNLMAEGVDRSRIFFVGNTMIDTLLLNIGRIKQPAFFPEQKFEKGNYMVLTLHRPSNVDDPAKLLAYLDELDKNRGTHRIIFPVHPRTKKILDDTGKKWEGIFITEPQSYLHFIYLVKNAAGVITDSGGITEETTVLGIPCLTLRDTTERPETVTDGTNELIGTNAGSLGVHLKKMASGNWKKGKIPEKWDGKTGERIVEILTALPVIAGNEAI